MSIEENKAIARRGWEEIWNKGNLTTAFPDLHFTIEDQIAEGDKVVNRVIARGTHQGELMGIPPTGKQVIVTGITIDRIVGGKLEASWANWDFLGPLQQFGVVPSMRKGGE